MNPATQNDVEKGGIRRRFMLVVLLAAVVVAAIALGETPQIKTSVSVVVVPVSVKDGQGRLVTSLKVDDFVISEDGKRQTVSQFSVEPSPLSAAVLIDTGMSGDALRNVAKTWEAISRSFTPDDEVATYRFDHFVTKLADFTSNPMAIERSLDEVTKIAADKGAADVPAEPGAGKLPDWLSGALRSHAPPTSTSGVPSPAPPRPQSAPLSKVFHDAVFTAATDLKARDLSRRKIIIVISDGRVTSGNDHPFEEVRDALLKDQRDQVQFFGISTDVNQPVMKRMVSIMDSYASPTGGDVYFKDSSIDIAEGFSQIVDQARNEYVLSYVSTNEAPKVLPIFRRITIKADSKLKVAHRNGYFQLPQP